VLQQQGSCRTIVSIPELPRKTGGGPFAVSPHDNEEKNPAAVPVSA
jgi:hypothetical protein